jgi:hypothetical protein
MYGMITRVWQAQVEVFIKTVLDTEPDGEAKHLNMVEMVDQ